MRARFAAVIVAALLAGCTSTTGDAPDAANTSVESGESKTERVLLGVSSPHEAGRPLAERINSLETDVVGAEFGAVRLYHRWDEPFPSDDEFELFNDPRGTSVVLSVSSERGDGHWVPWSDIATAEPGSPIRANLDAWADSVAAWPGELIVVFDHEPDFYRNGGGGSATDYLAAYETFASAIRAADSTDRVRLGWIGVAFFFSPSADTDATEFFPGRDLVDIVGADGFNWSVCRDDPGSWRSFEQIFAPFRSWADGSGLPVMLGEVGSVEDLVEVDRKAGWLRDAAAQMASPAWSDLETALFWDNIHENDAACDFRLASSSQSATAFAEIAAAVPFGKS